MDDLIADMAQLITEVPTDRALDHVSATAETAARRARWLDETFDLAGAHLVCIGDHEPPLGVPSINKRAPSRAIMRCHVSGFSSCIVRATSPPIECATRRTGCPLTLRTASAASTAIANRRASSSIGRRQS